MNKIIIYLIVGIFLLPIVYSHHSIFHYGAGKANGEACKQHTDCASFLCYNLDPNGLDMRCVECDKKIPVKGSGANAAACAKGAQGCDKAAGIVQPQCGPAYSVCNKNKEPYTCEKLKDACGGCVILFKCNEQTKKCESLFVSTNDCPTGSISYNPSSAEPNKKISFTANENDKNNDKVTCTWKDGSTKISTQCKFDYSFSLTGDHKITLEVTDGKNNCAETYSKNLQVTASESATPALQCKSNEHIIFTMSGNKDANVGTWDAGMNVQVCHKGDKGLDRKCTGNNKVLKYLTGKGYAPDDVTPDLKEICYGDYSCYLSSNSPCKEGFSCLASFKDVKNSVAGTCDIYTNKLCCKQGCPMVEMKCPKFIKDQDKKLKQNTLCKSDGKTAPGTCQPGCAFNGQFYGEGKTAIIDGKELVCDNGAWCPTGFKYDGKADACEPSTESCFLPVKCPLDTPTEEKKDLKWFTNNKCVIPDSDEKKNQACCFTKIGTTKYYAYNILPDKEEISFY